MKYLKKNKVKLNLLEKQKIPWHKKCLCLVEFNEVKEIEKLYFDHQSNIYDWLIVKKIEDIVIRTSIPYNYDKYKFKIL